MVERVVAAKMPAAPKRNKDDISEKDEFNQSQIVSTHSSLVHPLSMVVPLMFCVPIASQKRRY